jgi:hypothetical protein
LPGRYWIFIKHSLEDPLTKKRTRYKVLFSDNLEASSI